jgi:hypothetical protein
MTAPTPQMEWASKLRDRIEAAGDHNVRPARHVLNRLVALLYPLDINHIDVDLQSADGRMMRVSGVIAMFTDQPVAVVSVVDMLAMPTGPRDTEVHKSTRVNIDVVPRRNLRRVAMLEAQTDAPYGSPNHSPGWRAHEDLTEWPYSGRVTLHYEGLDQPVVMPSGRNFSDFQQFLPILLTDLNG